MKWFKHDSNARGDEKIEKLLMKYGADGYALYFYCLEIIAGNLSAENINFDLKHDAETLGYRLKLDTLRVEEIMKWMVGEGLFQLNTATQRVMCLGLLKRLDNTMSQNVAIRTMLADPEWRQLKETLSGLKKLPDSKSRREEMKREEKRREREEKRLKELKEYAENVQLTEKEYGKLIEKYGLDATKKLIEKLDNAKGSKGYQYKNDYRAILSWVVGEIKARPIPPGGFKTCPKCKEPMVGSACTSCGWGRR